MPTRTRILPIPMGVGPSPSEFYTKAEIDAMLANYAQLATTDLVNYYLKSETYTQAEIEQLVGQITSFEVVATLPSSDIKTNVIYLLGPIGTGADRYEEYIYSNNDWKKIGETSVDLSNYVTITQLNTALGFYTTTLDLNLLLQGKQDVLSSSNKLNADYVSDGTTNKVFTATEQTKLSNIADGAEVNVQADWNESDSSSDAYIQNKPTIPTATNQLTNNSGFITAADVPEQVKSDWNATTGPAQILNKPVIPTATNQLRNNSGFITAADVPAQVNSDWNASSGVAEILNKPTLANVATTGAYSDLSGTPTIPDDLNDLTDVTVSNPSNGQVLKYNSTSQKWENGTGGGGSSVVELTQSQYDALVTPDPDTTYIITDADAIDMDDYALKTEIEELTADKADKQTVTANTGSYKFPYWNEQGVITGSASTTLSGQGMYINGGFWRIFTDNWSNGTIYGPTSAGTSGQIPVSNGSGAPSWQNLTYLTGGLSFWLGTQAQYDALAPNYDSSTLYVISD